MALTVSANTFEVASRGCIMSKLQRKKIRTVFFLQLVFLVSLSSPIVQGTNPYGNLDKMDDALEHALQSIGDLDESFEVIFQLQSPVSNEDLNRIKNLGAVHLNDAELINGGLIEQRPMSSVNFRIGNVSSISNSIVSWTSSICPQIGVVIQPIRPR